MMANSQRVVICGGDFNFKLNPILDSLGSSPQNKPLPKKVKTSMEEMDIIDVWRDLHPKSRGYIHYSNPHSVYSIIDYVLYLLQTDLKWRTVRFWQLTCQIIARLVCPCYSEGEREKHGLTDSKLTLIANLSLLWCANIGLKKAAVSVPRPAFCLWSKHFSSSATASSLNTVVIILVGKFSNNCFP